MDNGGVVWSDDVLKDAVWFVDQIAEGNSGLGHGLTTAVHRLIGYGSWHDVAALNTYVRDALTHTAAAHQGTLSHTQNWAYRACVKQLESAKASLRDALVANDIDGDAA